MYTGCESHSDSCYTLALEKKDIHSEAAVQDDEENLGPMGKKYPMVVLYFAVSLCASTSAHAPTHKRTHTHPSVFKPQLPIRGCMGLSV